MNTPTERAEPLLYRIPEAAAALAMSRTVIYELIQRRELEVVHIGASCRVTAGSLREFVERRSAAELDSSRTADSGTAREARATR